MQSLPSPVEKQAQRRQPRYYVMRVLDSDRECSPRRVSVVYGPFADLAAAWRLAGEFSRADPNIYIAGEMAGSRPVLPAI